jgi:protein-disulfide isomerase
MKTVLHFQKISGSLSTALALTLVPAFSGQAFSQSTPVCTAEAPGESQGLFKADGKTYDISRLSPAQKQTVYEADEAHYEAVKSVIDSHLLDNFVNEEVKNSKKSKEEVVKALFTPPAPTDAEMRAWYEKNKGRIPYEYDKVKGEIAKILQQEGVTKKREALLTRIKNQTKFTLLIKKPAPPVMKVDAAGFPSKGSPAAKVHIVEFADYQCGHCKAASSIVKSVVEKYGDKVFFTYMDFPLHGEEGASWELAVAAACADAQGKFWPYHSEVWAEPHPDKESPLAIAQKVGLDEAQFKSCLSSDFGKERVRKSMQEAENLGISGTPSIFVNGRKISGYSAEILTEEIEKARR